MVEDILKSSEDFEYKNYKENLEKILLQIFRCDSSNRACNRRARMVEAFLPITAGIGRYHLMTVKSEFAIQRQQPAARMLAGHLGKYRCSKCGYRRPEPSIFVSNMIFLFYFSHKEF